jgi:hypothetical protein
MHYIKWCMDGLRDGAQTGTGRGVRRLMSSVFSGQGGMVGGREE